MPKAYLKKQDMPWHLIGLNLSSDPEYYSGNRIRVSKSGQAYVPGDSTLDPIRRYDGRIYYGTMVRPAAFTMSTYMPSLDTAEVPFIGRWVNYNEDFVDIKNLAWQRLAASVKSSESDMGVLIAEGRTALGMIAQRAGTIRRSYSKLRRGNFVGALKELGVTPLRRHRRIRWDNKKSLYVIRQSSSRRSRRNRKVFMDRYSSAPRAVVKTASSMWLEYHFGWSPLVRDIGDSVNVLSDPGLEDKYWVKCTGSASRPMTRVTGVNSGGTYRRTHYPETMRISCRQAAWFTVENRNAYLQNRLGLANPASIFWEIVPFSFVADWFLKIGTYLDSLTDLNGLSYKLPVTTYYYRGKTRSVFGPLDTGAVIRWNIHFTLREPSLSRYAWSPPLLKGFGNSLTRAATAVSLLVQLFVKDYHD